MQEQEHGQKNQKEPLGEFQSESGCGSVAQQYEVHPNKVTEWKRQLLEHASEVCDGACRAVKANHDPDIKTLHSKIVQLAGITERKEMIARFRALPVARQCQVLSLAAIHCLLSFAGDPSRGSLRMRRIDELHMEHPRLRQFELSLLM